MPVRVDDRLVLRQMSQQLSGGAPDDRLKFRHLGSDDTLQFFADEVHTPLLESVRFTVQFGSHCRLQFRDELQFKKSVEFTLRMNKIF